MSNWNITSLKGKEQKLAWEAEQYHHDIVGVSSSKCHDSDTVELNEGWKLFDTGVDVTMSCSGRGRHFCKPLPGSLCYWLDPTWRKSLSP